MMSDTKFFSGNDFFCHGASIVDFGRHGASVVDICRRCSFAVVRTALFALDLYLLIADANV